MANQIACIMTVSSRSPVFSENQVRSSRLQIATDVDGMTRRLVWNWTFH